MVCCRPSGVATWKSFGPAPITGEGIDNLLETLLLTADLHEYRANPDRPAMGTCLEAEQEGNRGVVAKLIVQNGTLHVGDIVVCGGAHGRVKAMYDTLHPRRKVLTAGPSDAGQRHRPGHRSGGRRHPSACWTTSPTPVRLPNSDITRSRSQSLSGRSVRVSFEEFQRRLAEGHLVPGSEVATLNLILRADVRGSLEAIQKELDKLHHDEVQIRILQAIGRRNHLRRRHAGRRLRGGHRRLQRDSGRGRTDRWRTNGASRSGGTTSFTR